MLSWLTKRLRRDEPGVFAYGKVPALPEYVRGGVNDDIAAELPGWMTKAVEWAATHRAGPWEQARRDGPALRFVLRSRNPNVVITGVVAPSEDSVGRPFPLSVAAVVPVKGAGEHAHLAPAAFAPFLREAMDLLPRVSAIRAPKDIDELVGSLRAPSLEDVGAIEERYEAWAREQLAAPLLASALGRDGLALQPTLHTILEATSPFRGKEAPPTALSVRLPTDPDQSLLTCLWLQIVRRASGWKETLPGYFASERDMLVQLGGLASPSALADSWAPDPASKYVCHVPEETSAYATAFPGDLSEVLADPGTTVSGLVERLGAAVR